MDLKNWPILYKDILRVKNKKHHVAICSLWTERRIIEKYLEGIDYNLIGNLYSAQGINALVRNVFANPQIRVIIMWGSDMALAGKVLLKLIKNGIDKNHRVNGFEAEIEKEIPQRAIELFRKKVKVIDLRRQNIDSLKKEVKRWDKKKLTPFLPRAQTFPARIPHQQLFPSEQVGFKVSGDKVASTWLKVLNIINRYGRPKHTRYAKNYELKEILNLTAVITDENPNKEYLPKYLLFSKQELESYYPELMTDRAIPGVAYNYGKLLRKDLIINQIDKMKMLLKKRPDSKKIVATLLWPQKFWKSADTSDTPCLTQIFGSVQDKKFFLTAHFRSQDMVHGWPRNAFGLRKLQQDIAKAADYPLGALTIITHSAHIYGDDWQLIENLLKQWYEEELGYSKVKHFEIDKRGNMVVEVVGKKVKIIRATLYAPHGGAVLKIFEGKTAQEVAWQITDWQYLVDPGHLVYLGLELQKAENKILKGGKYKQDQK